MAKNSKSQMVLSVAIITYNEESNIADCLDSCKDIADEIIVLDSFSTDRTAKIAKSYKKVKFSVNKFKGHIEQKNSAIELCSGSWILALDADERVSVALAKEIRKILQTDVKVNGFMIPRLTFHLGRYIRHSGWYMKRYRLFRKNFATWTGENPHDFMEIQGEGSELSGDIIHYSFRDLSHQVDTINSFSSIVSFTRFSKGYHFSMLKTIAKPIGKFVECYFLKAGFLDGFPGFVIAVSSAYSTFLKFAKIYEYDRKIIKRPSNLREDYGQNK